MAEKGCSRIYNKIMAYDGSLLKEIKEKWERMLNNNLTYDLIETAFKKLTKWKIGPYQKYFQFKFIHNRTITREKNSFVWTLKIQTYVKIVIQT